MYETTFEFYVPRNLLHKVKKLRYQLKTILKEVYYKQEDYINSNGVRAIYTRPAYSFAIGIIGYEKKGDTNFQKRRINNPRGPQKGGTLVVKVRTAKKLSRKVENQISSTLFENTDIELRKEKSNHEILKENRTRVMITSNENSDLSLLRKAEILVSSPLFYDLSNAKQQEKRPNYRKDLKFDYSNILSEVKENTDELKLKLNKSIEKKHGIKEAIAILNLAKADTAYIQFYKENKYDKINKKTGSYRKYLEEKLAYVKSATYPETQKKRTQTTLHGLKNIEIKFNPKLSKEELDTIYVHGLGGKNGLGMGFLWQKEENEDGK